MMGLQWLILLLVLGSSHGARILGIFPTPSISHQLPFQAVMIALAQRGHQVTVITTDPIMKPVSNYTEVDLSSTYEFGRSLEFNGTLTSSISPYVLLFMFLATGDRIATWQLESKPMQDFIKSRQQFDLVFMEDIMYQCYGGLIHHVGSPPVIAFLSLGGTSMSFDAMGNPNNPAVYPDLLFPYDDHMTFIQRLNNMVFGIWQRYLWSYRLLPAQEKVLRRFFGSSPPSVYESYNNFSLYFVNNHWSLSYPRPLLPNFIELGSLHLQSGTKPLPKDLAEFLDGASSGFVYFSLGSNVRSDKLPEHKRQLFLEAFAELPYRVLWKWESDTLPGQPSNVLLSKWLPQQDVLAHPNIRVFVTQGGLQSLQEATRHAVPVIGVPFLGDQQHNAIRVVTAGVGLALDFQTITKESILLAIRTVINNSSYRENMKRLSSINQDQPETPLERAVWWTEYVLRHNGAKHLRTSALDLAWYQYLLLDVIAFVLLVSTLTIVAAYIIVKKLWGFLGLFTKNKTKIS